MHVQLGKRNRTFQPIRQLISTTVFVTLFSCAVCAQDGLLHDLLKTGDVLNQKMLQVTALTDEEENQVGADLSKQILKDFKTTVSKKWDVKKVWTAVVKNVKRKKIKYSFTVIENEEVNAFAVAGGKVFINTGLLDFLKSEDELAFVIAHELAHNELKHCVKKIQYSAVASKIDPTIGSLVQVAYSVYSLPFTKYEEFAADDLGVTLATKAKYNKQGAIDFFTKLQTLEKKYGDDDRDPLNDFVSSHPLSAERKKRIEGKK